MRKTVKLSEVGEIVTGTTPSKKEPKYWGGSIPFVKPPHLGTDKLIVETEETLTEEGSKKGNLIPKNSIMVCCIGSLGKIGIAGRDLCTNQQINSIIFNDKLVDFKYGYYFCTTLENIMNRMANQALIQIINKSSFSNIEIPLPPFETQKAIVAKLDQIFAELDQTKSEIQKSLDNVDELWESNLNQAFQGDWKVKELGEVAEIGPKKSEVYNIDENTKVSFVPMSDLSQEEMLFEAKNENTISELRKGSYTYFKDNDVLLAKVTPCFENGKCGIAKDLTNGIGFGSSEFIVFRPKNFMLSEFLYYFVSNKSFREEGAKNMGGAVGLQRVKKDWIENYNIPVPPLPEQEKIVEHLDEVSKEVKVLKSKYQSQLDNLEELKKSILDKAFKGGLVE